MSTATAYPAATLLAPWGSCPRHLQSAEQSRVAGGAEAAVTPGAATANSAVTKPSPVGWIMRLRSLDLACGLAPSLSPSPWSQVARTPLC